MKYVTATIKGITATVDAFNGEDVISITCTASSKAHLEREVIAHCERNNLIFCAVTDQTENDGVKVAMDSQLFYAKATKMDKRPNGAYISRNVVVFKCDCLIYNAVSRKAEVRTFSTSSINPDVIKRTVNKILRASSEGSKFLKCLNTSEDKTLYVMSVDDFMKYGHIVEDDENVEDENDSNVEE